MSETVITVEKLSKVYRLGHQEKQETLFGAIASSLKSPLRNLRELQRLNTFNMSKKDEERDDILWALRDVSFEVKRGEVLGIVGRNGAGKSTLLKILSRIADPTHGRAEIRGRVSALLEVGTGFHPELTGRENVYLNGTILGMKKAEIDAKFDEIVNFSGVERFLDTPVKRYSSGMVMRLAFSVAAHLDPEILIIDEVLAVGDSEFQRKCLGKMGEVATGEGRTVLFVSHNIAAVRELCTSGLFLTNGRVDCRGGSGDIVQKYLRSVESAARTPLSERVDRRGYGELRLISVAVGPISGECGELLISGHGAEFRFGLSAPSKTASVTFTIYDSTSTGLCAFNSAVSGAGAGPEFICRVNQLNLIPGAYRVNVAVNDDRGLQDHVEGAVIFDVAPVSGEVMVDSRYSKVVMPHTWRMQL